MNVLLIGSGGRECSLAYMINKSPLLNTLYVDSKNPGFPVTAVYTENIFSVSIDLVVVGPENDLANGIADIFSKMNIPVFGPKKLAARLESSKKYAKELMNKLNIPTAKFESFDRETFSKVSAEVATIPCVIKVDGLAAGKGVYVCRNFWERWHAIENIDRHGSAADTIIVEELLTGRELSIIAICDGERSVMLPSCRDYKGRLESNHGLNTGGMGSICPVPGYGDEFLKQIKDSIVDPVLQEMKNNGHEFRGALYVGLMITDSGPKVLEFNVRFGDPECQALMMVLDEDLLDILFQAATGQLLERPIKTKNVSSCCVVLCTKAYPDHNAYGDIINIDLDVWNNESMSVFFAGVAIDNEKLITNGGRIMSICSTGLDLNHAAATVYSHIDTVSFTGMDYRSDIGK